MTVRRVSAKERTLLSKRLHDGHGGFFSIAETLALLPTLGEDTLRRMIKAEAVEAFRWTRRGGYMIPQAEILRLAGTWPLGRYASALPEVDPEILRREVPIEVARWHEHLSTDSDAEIILWLAESSVRFRYQFPELAETLREAWLSERA